MDQWCSQLNILFVGLFVAWEEDGDIPDKDAPLSTPTTKNAAAHAHLDKLLQEQLLTNLLEKNPNASDDQIARVKSATMNRSFKRHYETVTEFSAAIQILSSCVISPNKVQWGCMALSQSCQLWA